MPMESTRLPFGRALVPVLMTSIRPRASFLHQPSLKRRLAVNVQTINDNISGRRGAWPCKRSSPFGSIPAELTGRRPMLDKPGNLYRNSSPIILPSSIPRSPARSTTCRQSPVIPATLECACAEAFDCGREALPYRAILLQGGDEAIPIRA